MKSEEYYIIRDMVVREINSSCEEMDNDSINSIDTFTRNLIYEINKWRLKNDLVIFQEVTKDG